MSATREGEQVYIHPSTLSTKYGQLIQGLDSSNQTKFLKVSDEGFLQTELIDSSNGNTVIINDEGQLHTVMRGHVCTNNSTNTPLLANTTWTGTAEDILDYGGISLFVTSDVDSDTDGIEVQYSKDGLTNWRTAEAYELTAGSEKWFSPPAFGAYMRIKYTNGPVDQTSFELTTTLRKTPFKWSSHNIEDPIKGEDDAELIKAVITGKRVDGTYDNANLTNGNNLKISLEEIESDISEDSNTTLRVAPIIVDEYGNIERQIGDNIFRGAMITIPTEHHEIHCGDSYTVHHVQDLGNGGVHEYLITTPNWGAVDGVNTGSDQNVKIAHFVAEITGESETTFWLYESPTVTDNGNSLTVLNRNRNSTNTDFLTCYEGATVSASGTELEHGKFGSGKGVGGENNRTDEWVLKNNTTYLVRVQNDVTTNNYHTMRIQYYVHPGV